MSNQMVVVPTQLEALAEFVGFRPESEMFGPPSPFDRGDGVPSGLKAGQWAFKFPGADVSVVRHRGSYGRQQGLFELMAFPTEGDDEVPFSNDPSGFRTEAEILEDLAEIREHCRKGKLLG